ncbi:Srsf2 [Symbiodinium sp. KB8]|nr:Srsf2 [Symbiodinium sp. KB8]
MPGKGPGVGDVFIPRSKFSDRPCGYAFVRFFDERDGMEAVKKMNRSTYDGCVITVAKAQVGCSAEMISYFGR